MAITMLERDSFLKPAFSTDSVYVPTSRFGKAYNPASVVTVSRDRPVVVCVAVTVAPATAPPLRSATDPDNEPVLNCAKPGMERTSTNERKDTGRRERSIGP